MAPVLVAHLLLLVGDALVAIAKCQVLVGDVLVAIAKCQVLVALLLLDQVLVALLLPVVVQGVAVSCQAMAAIPDPPLAQSLRKILRFWSPLLKRSVRHPLTFLKEHTYSVQFM
jgi:hypothetical protein